MQPLIDETAIAMATRNRQRFMTLLRDVRASHLPAPCPGGTEPVNRKHVVAA
jgi:hypothetical protein